MCILLLSPSSFFPFIFFSKNRKRAQYQCFLSPFKDGRGSDWCYWLLFDASARELADSLTYVPIYICMNIWCLTVTVTPSFFKF